MKCKIFANKKGIGIDDAVPLIIFIFVAALVVVVFRINEQIKSDKLVASEERQKQIVEGHEILMAYLMQIDDQGNNKADFLSNSYLKGNYNDLKKDFNVVYDKSGSIGRRYARNDEMGTLFCITIDEDSLKKKEVTVRKRDSAEQVGIKIRNLKESLRKAINDNKDILNFGKIVDTRKK